MNDHQSISKWTLIIPERLAHDIRCRRYTIGVKLSVKFWFPNWATTHSPANLNTERKHRLQPNIFETWALTQVEQ